MGTDALKNVAGQGLLHRQLLVSAEPMAAALATSKR